MFTKYPLCTKAMELGHMDNGYGKKELVNIIGLV
jgi:GTP1/Obg family GTP-binding protein